MQGRRNRFPSQVVRVLIALLLGLTQVVGVVSLAHGQNSSANTSSVGVTLLAIAADGKITKQENRQISLASALDFGGANVPTWGDNSFVYAVWFENDAPAVGANINASELRKLRLSRVELTDNGEKILLSPDQIIAAPNQERVELKADVMKTGNHLALVYLDVEVAKGIPVEWNTDEVKQVIGGGFTQTRFSSERNQIVGGTAVFSADADQQGKYVTTLLIRTWWDRTIKFVDQQGADLEFSLRDDISNTDSRIQAFKVSISRDVSKIKIVGTQERSKVAVKINQVPRSTQSGYQLPIAYNIPVYEAGSSVNVASNAPQIGGKGSIDDSDWSYDEGKPDQYGYGSMVNGGADPYSGYRSFTYTQDGSLSKFSFTVDAIPQICNESNLSDSECSYNNYYQDWLSKVTVNGQVFNIPAPRLCQDPNGNTVTEACGWGGLNQWSTNGTKKKYYCVRAWVMGLALSYNNSDCTGSGGNFAPRKLFTQTVTSGPNSGVTITVELVNARIVGDKGYTIADTSVGNADNLYWYSKEALHAEANRWRSRYRITLSDIKRRENTIEVNYDWSAHNSTKVNSSLGINAVPATAQSSPISGSVSVYGGTDDNSSSRWQTMCASCSAYNFQDANSNPTDVPIAFQVQNGFVKPVVRYQNGNTFAASGALGEYQTSKNTLTPVPGVGEYLSARLPKSTGTVVYNSGYTVFNRFSVPLQVDAESLSVNLNFYKQQPGSQGELTQLTTGFPANVQVDGLRQNFFVIPSGVPSFTDSATQVRVFSHWQLAGYKAGNLIGVVRDNLQVGDTVDIHDLRFTDGSRALSNVYGEAIIDELRLIAVPAELTDAQTIYYPAQRVLMTTPERVYDSFVYAAVAGLSARIADDYFSVGEKKITDAGVTYKLNEASSIREIEELVHNGEHNSEILTMYYAVPQTIKYVKTVDSSSGWTGSSAPGAAGFRLRLIPDGSDAATERAIVIAHDQAVEVGSGTYRVEEQIKAGSQWVTSYVWTPGIDAFVCRADGSNDNLYQQDTSKLILSTDQSREITCQVTNQAAAVALVTYDPTGSDVGQGYSFSFTPSAENLPKYEDWRAKSVVTQSGDFFPGGQQYQLVGTAPAGMKILGYQRFSGEPSEKSAAQIHFGTADKWGPITGAENRSIKTSFPAVSEVSDNTALNDNNQRATGVNITTVNNQFDVYRAVVVPESQLATLKFTKKYAADTPATNPLQLGPTQRDYPEANWALELQRTGGFKTLIGHNHTNLDPNNPGGLAYLQKGSGYTVQEKYQAAAGQEYGINNAFGATSFTCDKGGTVENGQLTLQQGDACTVTNAPARFSVVLYSPESQQFLDNDQVKLNFVTSDETARVLDQNWPGKANPRQSATWLTPEAAYSVAVSLPAGWYYTGLERYPADTLPDQLAADDTWEPVTNITVPAGKHYVYRVNASPIRAELPAAGSLLTPFVFLGLGLALIAGGFAARRRLARAA